MTKVKINPGVCGLVTAVEATSPDGFTVELNVRSGCDSVNGMFKALGTSFDAFELCLKKPGDNPFYTYAAENFPGHAACPTIAGILKAIEVECKLALPKDVSITFEQ